MEKLQIFALCLSIFINICTVVGLIYAFYKFTSKPRTDLEARVTEVEVRVKETRESLLQGNDRFREQAKTNKAIFNIMLAFIDFEIAYCHATGYKDNSDLIKAKGALEEYLTDR